MRAHTIYRDLAVVRRILTLAARLWRDECGLTWLETAPLLQLLDRDDARKPYPLSWDEQARLFARLPDHLGEMALFKVNTGTREQANQPHLPGEINRFEKVFGINFILRFSR